MPDARRIFSSTARWLVWLSPLGFARVQALELKNSWSLRCPTFRPESKARRCWLKNEKRTAVRAETDGGLIRRKVPVIAVGKLVLLRNLLFRPLRQGIAGGAQGHRSGRFPALRQAWAASSGVFAIGDDARGVLFGIGQLLRELHMQPGSMTLADELDLITALKYLPGAVINSVTVPRPIPMLPGSARLGAIIHP